MKTTKRIFIVIALSALAFGCTLETIPLPRPAVAAAPASASPAIGPGRTGIR
ncbi:MAG: hypothetical protein FD146_1778 [Anaerolineaceae bacterium]|nr:MAG: hypothetical protein FD146_1778 [Anaerolineaceae bacterium]